MTRGGHHVAEALLERGPASLDREVAGFEAVAHRGVGRANFRWGFECRFDQDRHQLWGRPSNLLKNDLMRGGSSSPVGARSLMLISPRRTLP